MNDSLPPCPECSSAYSYELGALLVMDGVGDHDMDCKVDGVGPVQLKSSVVKKS